MSDEEKIEETEKAQSVGWLAFVLFGAPLLIIIILAALKVI